MVVVDVVDDVESVAGAAVLSVALSVAGAIAVSLELVSLVVDVSVDVVWPQAATPKARTAAAAAAKPSLNFVIGMHPCLSTGACPGARPTPCQGLPAVASDCRERQMPQMQTSRPLRGGSSQKQRP